MVSKQIKYLSYITIWLSKACILNQWINRFKSHKIYKWENIYIEWQRNLTSRITLPHAENCSPAISISTVVSAPTAGFETHARKWRTTSSYNFCGNLKTMNIKAKFRVSFKKSGKQSCLTRWSWLHPASPAENFVGWMGGWALSSCPPPLGFLQSPAPGSNNRCAYIPHSGCPCCSCTIVYS